MTNLWHLFEHVAYAFLCHQETAVGNTKAICQLFRARHHSPRHRECPQGAARLNADVGNQATVRQPVSWAMFLAGEKMIPSWRSERRVWWLALCSAFFFLTRASEMLTENRYRIHGTYCLRRADAAFIRSRAQLWVAQWSTADRVEVCFRGCQGDQLRKGAVVSRVRAGSPRPVGAGGGAVNLVLELMSR